MDYQLMGHMLTRQNQLMVEEKEGKYIIGLLDCDTHNWVTGMRAVNG